MNALIAIFLFACIAIWISKRTSGSDIIKRSLRYIGNCSLIYLCTNHFLIRIARKVLQGFNGMLLEDNIWVEQIVIFPLAMLGMTIISEIFNRTRLCVLIGKF